jgi:hypothetical protein
MQQQEILLEQARLLVNRLERIYVDSIWARRSSGHRGNLLKWIDKLEACRQSQQTLSAQELSRLENLIRVGYRFLEKAAREHMR